jgi:gliding motility-associated-like protein
MRLRTLYITFLFLLCAYLTHATHNRAGEITYTWLGGFSYEVVITTYTKESAPADRCELVIQWGDNTSSTLYRENGPSGSFCSPPARLGESLGDDVRLNIYRGQHTYQSPGFYTLAMQDLNRNGGIANIPGSINVPFYITTVINVNPALGPNSSPVLLNPPIDDGCINRKFIHNPGVWDPDGDSISYSLIDCRGLNGIIIPETYDPALVQDPVTIDPITGDFVWDVPQNIGQFNFAILITEYRKGPNGIYQVIGQITRDMQLDIEPCNNQPPVLNPVGPFCVEVGQNLQFTVQATDPDNDKLTLTATGGPLEVAPTAQFAQPSVGNGSVQQVFSWTPACVHVQKQPWFMYFKVVDDPSTPGEPELVDFLPVEITVIAPAPENPQAVSSLNAINLSWDASICTNANGYDIYRREGYFGYIPDSCETGVPEYTGYSYLASTSGLSSTSYQDSMGLKRGMQYCYMIVATFPDESESRASIEVCSELAKTIPIITHVDVLSTDVATGEIFIDWVPPRTIDSNLFPPPYGYILERADGIDGGSFTQIATLNSLTDTNFTDTGLNTQDQGYTYRVGFLSGQNNELVGTSDAASSVYLEIFPFDLENRLSFTYNVPWLNEAFTIYRESSPGSGQFDSIATSSTDSYIDTGLVNGETYCYYVRARGRYTGSELPDPLFNRSQINCATPLDTTAPCPPELSANADCEEGIIELFWRNVDGEFCSPDITSYNLYYKPTDESEWPATPLVANIPPGDTTITITDASIVGCYAVTAIDDATPPNESDFSNEICVDGCSVVELPNVFSPNGNPPNNFFRPVRDQNGVPQFKDIEEFKIEVFNRWGSLIYTTQNEDEFVETGWDGTDMNSGQPVAEGVYFYVFTYRPKSVLLQAEQVLNGTITLFR